MRSFPSLNGDRQNEADVEEEERDAEREQYAEEELGFGHGEAGQFPETDANQDDDADKTDGLSQLGVEHLAANPEIDPLVFWTTLKAPDWRTFRRHQARFRPEASRKN